MKTRMIFCIVIASCLLATCTRNDEKARHEKPLQPIKLAQRDWLSFKLTNMVAKILLEEEMGYETVLVDVDGDEQFESLSKGDIHVILEVWPSSWHDELQSYLYDNALVEHAGELGVLGKTGWFIPTYVSEEYPSLRNWNGFKDPEAMSRFISPESGEEGRFLGGDPDWKEHDKDIIRNLGLALQVEMTGSEEALIEAVKRAYRNRKPVVFHLWTPHSLFAELNLTQVQLPPANDACYAEKSQGGFDCEYKAESLMKLVWPGLTEHAPQVAHFVRNFRLTNEDQISMLGLVEIDGKRVEEAARLWVQDNRQTWELWLP